MNTAVLLCAAALAFVALMTSMFVVVLWNTYEYVEYILYGATALFGLSFAAMFLGLILPQNED